MFVLEIFWNKNLFKIYFLHQDVKENMKNMLCHPSLGGLRIWKNPFWNYAFKARQLWISVFFEIWNGLWKSCFCQLPHLFESMKFKNSRNWLLQTFVFVIILNKSGWNFNFNLNMKKNVKNHAFVLLLFPLKSTWKFQELFF